MSINLKALRRQNSPTREEKAHSKRPSNDDIPTKKRPSNDDTPITKKKASLILDSALKETKQFLYHTLAEYSLKHESFLGVDITPHYIRLCQMDNTKKKPTLKNLASACIEDNFILDDIFANPNVYIENLSSLVEKEGLNNKEVTLSIPVSGTIIRTLHVPEMTDEELQTPETLRSLWHVSLAMDVDVDEYAISVQIMPHSPKNYSETLDPSQKTMEILLVAVRHSILSIFVHIAKSAGLKPSIAVLRCFALENALSNIQKEKEGAAVAKTAAFLEFGADENYLFIPNSNGVSTYEIYLANDDRMSLAQNTMDNGAIDALSEKYAKQIEKTISFHQKHYSDKSVSDIYVTSSLPLHMKRLGEMPIISTFIAKLSNLLPGYKVSECTFCDNAEISEQFTDTVNAEGKLSAWVVTMGLAASKLDAFGYLANGAKIANMNMLPEAASLKKAERIKVVSRWGGAAALLCLCVLSILSYAIVAGRETALTNAISPLLQVEQRYNTKMSKLDTLRSVKAKLDTLDKIRGDLSSNQSLLLSAYNYLGKTIPDGIWLKNVTFEAPNSLTITGNSIDDQNILEFINLLNKSEEFGQVSLKTMQAVREMAINSQGVMAVKKFELGGKFLTQKSTNEITPSNNDQ